MKKAISNNLHFFKATLVLWLMTAVFTQGFAAGLSCVHHFNPNTTTQTSFEALDAKTMHFNTHSNNHQISTDQLSNHYHHSLLQSKQLEAQNNSHSMMTDTHCDTQTDSKFQHNDCKCTYFISVELLETPILVWQQTPSFSAIPTLVETFRSTDFTSIYRPPLNA